MYDSIDDLNTALAEPVDLSGAHRIDAGHFAGSEEAFRHWDAEGEVPASCAKCHSASGLPTFLEQGVSVSAQPANGFQCTTCHNDLAEFTLHEVEEVTFPSGAVVSATPETNLCLNCHQGRESGADVDNLIGDADADTVSESLRFLNVHYFAAGATRYGGEVNGAYQYEGKEYAGFFDHSNSMNECNDCHATHSLEVDAAACAECHEQVEEGGDVRDIRYYDDDLDGDGDVEEGMAYEIETMLEVLYTQLQAYAADEVGTPIVYDSHSHPYFFTDTNGNGEPDPDETTGENQYNTWTPRLLRAAYNYQYVQKDPGAFVHNGVYITQVLQDSIEDLGGDVSGMLRP
jgi:ferredoxin